MDVELLSASAGGDAGSLLGQLASLLIFGSLLLAYGALTIGQGIRREASPAAFWATARFLISLNMLVVGLFALLNWDSVFPDRRDAMVLGPLPVRGRTLFAAKVAAAASALGIVVVASNSLAGLAWPLMLTPPGAGPVPMMRSLAAFWISIPASCAFAYCVVLGVQATAAQLPRSWYLRVSPFVQMGLFVLFLGLAFFQPSMNTPAELAAPGNQRMLGWLAPYWFLGLHSEVSGIFAYEGHAGMAPLARRAVVGLASAIVVACGAFLLSYLRTLRKIVEEPDVAPKWRGGISLPRFGAQPQTALAQFVIRTLVRSPRHRTILAFYVGGGLAVTAVYLGGAKAMLHLAWIDLVRRADFPMLVASALMLCAAWLGTRTVFALPVDLRANWLFRIPPEPGSAATISAVRRALFVLAVLPIWLISAALLLAFWPLQLAVSHLLVLALLGSILVDVSLNGFRKIPFTCSYLPGKTKVHLVFWFGIIPLVIVIHKAAQVEFQAMQSPLSFWAMASILAGAALAVRIMTNRSASRNEPSIEFEQAPSDELVGLGLNR